MWFIKIICVHSTQNTFVLSISFFNMKMCVAQALEQINVFASLFCCCRSRSCSRRRCCCCSCSDFHYNSSACFTRLHCHCAEYVQDYFAPSVSYFYEITFFFHPFIRITFGKHYVWWSQLKCLHSFIGNNVDKKSFIRTEKNYKTNDKQRWGEREKKTKKKSRVVA